MKRRLTQMINYSAKKFCIALKENRGIAYLISIYSAFDTLTYLYNTSYIKQIDAIEILKRHAFRYDVIEECNDFINSYIENVLNKNRV